MRAGLMPARLRAALPRLANLFPRAHPPRYNPATNHHTPLAVVALAACGLVVWTFRAGTIAHPPRPSIQKTARPTAMMAVKADQTTDLGEIKVPVDRFAEDAPRR